MLDKLVTGWINHFWAADHSITWLGVEEPLFYWLDPITALVGVSDAHGLNGEGTAFFGEWKTANPRERETWKQVWRKSPQALTYGVLHDGVHPGIRTFTVRKAFKPTSVKGKFAEPSYDHAWFTYDDAELKQWRFQLMEMAHEIRVYRGTNAKLGQPWPTNFRSCFDYGVKYPCPFFAGCDHQDWNLVPVDAVAVDGRLKTLPPDARPWGQEQLSNFSPSGASNELVVLSATSVETWLRCRERYRKHYEVGLDLPSNEAADLGRDFHHAIARHIRSLIKE